MASLPMSPRSDLSDPISSPSSSRSPSPKNPTGRTGPESPSSPTRAPGAAKEVPYLAAAGSDLSHHPWAAPRISKGFQNVVAQHLSSYQLRDASLIASGLSAKSLSSSRGRSEPSDEEELVGGGAPSATPQSNSVGQRGSVGVASVPALPGCGSPSVGSRASQPPSGFVRRPFSALSVLMREREKVSAMEVRDAQEWVDKDRRELAEARKHRAWVEGMEAEAAAMPQWSNDEVEPMFREYQQRQQEVAERKRRELEEALASDDILRIGELPLPPPRLSSGSSALGTSSSKPMDTDAAPTSTLGDEALFDWGDDISRSFKV